MYKSWKSWKLVLGYLIKSFWKNTGVQEPKTEQFEEFGAAWSRSRLCCSRSRVSQRVENFRRIASLCNFLLAINTSQRRKNFQRIAISSLIDRDQTLIFGSAPSGRRPDREQIPVARDQYRDFWKIRAFKCSDLSHFNTKSLQTLSKPSESADKHNLALHSCSNQPQSRNTLSLFLSKTP